MAAGMYEISLLFVFLSSFESSREIFFKFNFSKRPCNVLYHYININDMPKHFNEIQNHFTAIYYVLTETVNFLHVRITCHSLV